MEICQYEESDNPLVEERAAEVIQKAIKVILEGLGEDVNRDGLKKTPLRVAKALLECTSGCTENPKDVVGGALFPEAAYGRVNVQGLHLFSLCESCLLPFHVKCHVSYVPANGTVVGLSKLSRVSSIFAKRLQDPQRLADEICASLHQELNSPDVAVALQCLHIRFPNRESFSTDPDGDGWARKCTRSGSGLFSDEKSHLWVDFLRCLKLGGNDIDFFKKASSGHPWCPAQAPACPLLSPKKPDMIAAVVSILVSLGENPSRKELVDTPTRFVGWMMNFQNLNLEMKLNLPLKSPDKAAAAVARMHCEPNLCLWSQCEHHLLPFYGKVHICFYEGASTLGKALLQSVVHFYGLKLQVQERLTAQIATTIASVVGDVLVVVEAEHMCMMCRGVRQIGSKTVTEVCLGRFLSDRDAQSDAWSRILRA